MKFPGAGRRDQSECGWEGTLNPPSGRGRDVAEGFCGGRKCWTARSLRPCAVENGFNTVDFRGIHPRGNGGGGGDGAGDIRAAAAAAVLRTSQGDFANVVIRHRRPTGTDTLAALADAALSSI